MLNEEPIPQEKPRQSDPAAAVGRGAVDAHRAVAGAFGVSVDKLREID